MRASLASATSLLALLLLDQREVVAAPIVSANQPASFGNVLVGANSGAVSSIVTVSGQTAGSYLTVSAGSASFAGAGLDQSTGSATASQTVSYTFSPMATGTFNQNVIATDTSSGSNSVILTLTGTGVAPLATGTVTNASVSNYILVGQTGTVTLGVSNATGTGDLAGTGTAYNLNGSITGGNSVFVGTASTFSLNDNNYTGSGKTTSASYAYTFKPTVAGVATTTVVTSFTNGVGTANRAGSVTTTLSGTGVAPIEAVSSTTAYARIGSGVAGTGAVTVQNIGNGNLAGTGAAYNLNGSVTNALGTGFTANTSNNNTIGLTDGSTSTLGYTYTPASSRGTTTSTVTIAFTNGNSAGTNLAQSVAAKVTGQAVGPTYASMIKNGAVDTPTVKGTKGAVAAAGASISFGSVGYKASQTIYLELENITTDANGGNALLTNLTIDKYTITGTNASQFSLSLTNGSIITEGGMLLVPITVTGTAGVGALSSSLTIFTDQSTGLGGAGDTFTYALTAMSVPEPTSLAVLGAGVAGLASFRRRRAAP